MRYLWDRILLECFLTIGFPILSQVPWLLFLHFIVHQLFQLDDLLIDTLWQVSLYVALAVAIDESSLVEARKSRVVQDEASRRVAGLVVGALSVLQSHLI